MEEFGRLERELNRVVTAHVAAVFGANPDAGYFGWRWTYNPDRAEVTIYPHTYGGYMDSQVQPLAAHTVHVDDLETDGHAG